ncbi:MAG: zinc-ribbon domain-containing protein [Hydrococcus sp. C42_A2020_068]|nr:zinc-ribbon domain-containing protein [Hydrococcus sp. C42_A2020_068]
MAYVFELGTGQRVYLEDRGMQTVVTVSSGGPGQQQQSSSSIQTGKWTSPPELLQTPNGAVIKITTARGEHHIQIQGNSIGVTSRSSGGGDRWMQGQQVSSTSVSSSFSMPSMQPMKPMEPMNPMEPMKMGDMEMSANPMQMRMGNMEMRMGSATQTQVNRRFCSQCGAPVEPSDRFCSSCGHQLS